MATDKKATYSIQFKSNVAETSDKDSDSLEALQRRMQQSQESIKLLQAAQRGLKGSTDEVKAAREQLKAQMNVEQGAVTRLQLSLLKQGTSYEQLAAKAKKSGDEQKKTSDVVGAAGGPVANLRDRLSSLKETITGAGGASGIAQLALLGFVAAVVAVTTAVVVSAFSVAKWALAVGNAQRTAGLFREAALGSADGARALGDQIDRLAQKVSTPKEKINELSIELSKMRLSGRAIVDTLNLVTQASDAMGDTVGKKLQDIITRSQMSGGVGTNALELQGTNVDFDELAKNLAAGMNTGVKEARAALLTGRAPIEAAAKALRTTVDKQFGEINARKMLDINVQAVKFHETFAMLVKDIKLEPLLKALDEMRRLFSENTMTGSTLKQLLTSVGNSLVKVFTGSVPIAKAALQGFLIATLTTILAVKKLAKAYDEAFGDSELAKNIDVATLTMQTAELAVYALAASLAVLAAGVALVAAPFYLVYKAVKDVYTAIDDASDYLAGLDWSSAGTALIDGFVSGLTSRIPIVGDMVGGLADDIKKRFKLALGIASPSKVFAEFGRNTVEGYERGVDENSDRAQSAIDSMAPSAPSARASSSSGGSLAGATFNLNMVVNVGGAGDASSVKAAVEEAGASLLARVKKLIDDSNAGAEEPVAA